MLRCESGGVLKRSCNAVDCRPGRFAMAARSLRGYGRHSRKSSYSFVTIRKLLTRCGARMPLMGAEYRRVASRGALLARAQSELAACDPEGFESIGITTTARGYADDGA